MATINATNQVASSAIRGESVIVTLNGAESLSVLPVLALGQLVTNNSNSVTGYIDVIDPYGHTFSVGPVQQDKQFNTGTTNTLAAAELLTITY